MKKVKLEYASNFERYEKKFILQPNQWDRFMMEFEKYMQLDEYGLHTICSLYYDTSDFAYVRHSLDKPDFKEKLRVRSYGIPTKDHLVFLELKKKLKDITYKRRVGLKLEESEQYMANLVLPENPDLTWKEIDWFCHRTPLEPKVIISYDRLAFFAKDNPDFRVTLDQRIRWREDRLDLSKGDAGSLLLAPGAVLIEVKTMDALPLWLCSLLSKEKLYPVGYSKYGFAYGEIAKKRELVQNVG